MLPFKLADLQESGAQSQQMFSRTSDRLPNASGVVQVEQLSRDVHRQQGVTISMASNKG